MFLVPKLNPVTTQVDWFQFLPGDSPNKETINLPETKTLGNY